ncbi:MAG: SUMF1/EgtB/PvdO family nonheme iron enzyme [Nitrospinota bacterium]|nr:SUMF1/EgtB/PvdO family nonheme iron enzyme [Nitrospinota bacterium]
MKKHLSSTLLKGIPTQCLLTLLFLLGPLALSVNAEDVGQILKAADKQFLEGNYAKAEADYSRAMKIDPKYYRILKSLAETKMKLKKFKDAETLIDRLLAIPIAKGRNILVFRDGETEPQRAELVDETVMAVDQSAAPEDLGSTSKFLRRNVQEEVPHYRVYLKSTGKVLLLPQSKTRIQYMGIPLSTWNLAKELKAKIRKEIIASGTGSADEMVNIKGGCFKMGSTQGDPDEQPVHEVCVDPFQMAKFEVTQKNFQDIMKDNPSQNVGANLPADSLTWDEARDYCEKSGNRLPTEAEWEFAARAGTTTEFYWGNQVKGKEANFCDSACELNIKNPNLTDGFKHTAPVGSFPPNPFGLHDMSGNVGEWVADWMDDFYYRTSSKDNPRGPNADLEATVSQSVTHKVYRGGSWNQVAGELRSANRRGSIYQLRAEGIGFRCAH